MHSLYRVLASCFLTIALLTVSVVTIGSLLPLDAAAQAGNWPEYQFGNDRLGVNPYERVLNAANVTNLRHRWEVNEGDELIMTSPAVANGIIYGDSFVTGKGIPTLFALDARTGRTVWRRPMLAQFLTSSPAVANGVLYVGVGLFTPYYTGGLYAFDAATGTPLWSNTQLDAIQSSPAVANGVVYVGSVFGTMYALDANSGNVLWSYVPQGGSVNSSPAVVNGVVYVGADNFYVYALDAATGNVIWRYRTDSAVSSSPSVTGGVVYVASADTVYALTASAGTLLWSTPVSSLISGSTTVAYSRVFVCAWDGTTGMAALNAQTGAVQWTYPSAQCEGPSSPTVANGVVYVGSQDGYVSALNPITGALLWHDSGGSPVWASPIVVNGMLYVADYHGDVISYTLNGQ